MCKKHGTDPPDREGNKESLVAMHFIINKKNNKTFPITVGICKKETNFSCHARKTEELVISPTENFYS